MNNDFENSNNSNSGFSCGKDENSNNSNSGFLF